MDIKIDYHKLQSIIRQDGIENAIRWLVENYEISKFAAAEMVTSLVGMSDIKE